MLPDGLLVRAHDDAKVYYLQNNTRRWIDSEQAFHTQGFSWADLTLVDRSVLQTYSEGEPITADAHLGLQVERLLVPDLAPVAPYDIRFSVEGGRTLLRFTATFWNRGRGAMELNADAPVGANDGDYPAAQRVFRPDGTFLDSSVGTLFWHDVHSHYHFNNFGEYRLEMVRPVQGANVMTRKTTFCLRDDEQIGAPADGVKQSRKYLGCTGHRQGVSVGWADVYRYTLPDQNFDVTNLPAGVYRLTFQVDPFDSFIESRRDNNRSATLVELDPSSRTLRVIATASPYETPNNRFPDGTLIKAEGDPKVYQMRNNRKRWIRTEEIFLSYGYSWGSIYELPSGTVDILPLDRFVRANGAIYVLNDAGYRRRILNPDVFRSYGLVDGDVADINQIELSGYPETNLIRREGDHRIFSISEKRAVAALDALPPSFNLESVHVVNETDFRAYSTVIVGQDLSIPWDVALLPGGDMLVTERTGTVRRIGSRSASMVIPSVHTAGEGGLMGIALHPDFAQNNLVYLYYTTDAGGRKNRVVRFRLDGDRLVEDRVILDDIPSATYHDGGQIEFGPDGKLYILTGDASNPNSAQDVLSLAGKILRVNDDGSFPPDNPFNNAVWSYGHRNPQGMAWDAVGRMYAAEHGPTGEFGLCCLDEINRIEKGGNYGWPIVTGDATRAGMISPILQSGGQATWAPSGLAFANGSLYFSGLRGSKLYQAPLRDDGSIAGLHEWLSNAYGRLRAVVHGADGYLYITTSNRDGRGTVRSGDDKILRIHPDFLH
jgi:glucose/arabinose dehydrogenase